MLSNAQGSGTARWAAVPMLLLAAVLTFLAAQGFIEAIAALVIAVYLTAILIFGATRVGIATLMACFVTAPAYKGIAGGGSTVTPTDALLLVGFGMLLPRVLSGRMRLPPSYVAGGAIIGMCGLIGTLGSGNVLISTLDITFWMFVMIAVPIAVNMWQPSAKVIRLLAWSYVAGQLVSWVGGRALGHVTGGRDYGLTQHPNYFAEGGLMAVALLIYLFFTYSNWRPRMVVLLFAAICSASVLASGSRAAPLVLAVLILMIPLVERSAITGFVWAVGGAVILGVSPWLLNLAGQTSSVSRLLGNGTAAGSDQARSAGLKTGLQMVREKPVFGRGLVTADLFNIHNNYLEVAVAVGVIGLIGYLFALFSFARPLFGNHEHRRLSYLAVAYVGWGATVPALYDRSIWLPLALVAVCWVRPPVEVEDADAAEQPKIGAAGRPLASPRKA